VERDHLAQLLDTSGYASKACRHALLEGAEFIFWDGSVPASRMLPAYERRQSHTLAEGIPTLGFAEAVDGLRSMGTEPVRLGQVTVVDPPYLFMVFLTADSSTIVGCLGIGQQRQAGSRPGDRTVAPA
jgi:hypothetical protein